MSKVIQIVEFLKSGYFGNSKNVHFGMDRNQLLNLFGETEYVFHSNKNLKYPTIYKYGYVEFYFEKGQKGRLIGIQIKPAINKAPNKKLNINYGFIQPKLEFGNALELLKANLIKFELFDIEYDDEADPKRILTEGNVTLIFDSEFEIEKVYRFADLKSNKPDVKQIHVQIEEATYESLKQLAIQKGISIKNLCRDILQEYVGK